MGHLTGKTIQLMFSGCESLAELDLTCFDTGKAVTFEEMFKGCKALKTLDIRYFDTITGGRYSKTLMRKVTAYISGFPRI